MHGLDLLLALGPCIVQCLVLLLDQRDLPLHLLLPLRVVVLLSLLVLLFELADFLKFSFFLNFQNGLFASLRQEDVKNWLHFPVVLKEVVVTDLGLFVDTCLFGNVLRRWRFRQEFIRLGLYVALLWRGPALLGKEVGKVNFDAGRRPWAQVVRLDLRLRLLKFEQLLFDHLHLLFFAFHLDALLLLLSRCQVLLQQIQVVCVSPEDAFIVHDVESLAFIVIIVVGRHVLELLLLAHHLWLGSLKRLSHIFKFN